MDVIRIEIIIPMDKCVSRDCVTGKSILGIIRIKHAEQICK